MNHHHSTAASSFGIPFQTGIFASPQHAEERLPFTVRIVDDATSLSKAVQIRHAGYARHLPELAETLRVPEAMDTAPGVVVLLAESKLDGSPLGTARIQTNRYRPLAVEQSVTLPVWMEGERLAEVTRLAIAEGRIGRLVKLVLIKGCLEYCQQQNVAHAIAAGRAPIDRQYEQLLFQDLFPEVGFFPLRHAGNLPHRVMSFAIQTGEARWTAAKHPQLKFFFHTRHPDLSLVRAADWPANGITETLAPHFIALSASEKQRNSVA